MVNPNDLNYLQSTLYFWDKINKSQKSKIIENTISIKYLKGENIYNPNKECLGIILIKKGELRRT